MIDLHIHTKFSDGTDDCINILKKAEQQKLEYISITDHNNCYAYDELKNINIDKYYSGNLITGIELNSKILGIPIEVLGYKINTTITNELVKKLYVSTEERNIIEVKRLYQKCIENNIDINEKFIKDYTPDIYASKYFHKFLTKNPKNKDKIDKDAWSNSNIFYRKYMSNPKTIFFVDTSDILPDLQTVINLIKKAGGLVFLPHVYEYRDNADNILHEILQNYNIDGIECFYTTFTDEQTNYLLNICEDRQLFISGGSDYHGTFKPNVNMGTGKGNLKISKQVIEDWA